MAVKPFHATFLVEEHQIPALQQVLAQFQPVLDDAITMAEASREFGVSAWTIDHWVNKAGLIPFTQPVPGGKKYVRRSDIQALLEVREAKKKAPKRRKGILNMGPK